MTQRLKERGDPRERGAVARRCSVELAVMEPPLEMLVQLPGHRAEQSETQRPSLGLEPVEDIHHFQLRLLC